MAQVKAGNLTSRSSAGVDTVTLGWQPKAVILFVARAGFSSSDLSDGDIQNTVVISDGTATRAAAMLDDDGVGSTNAIHGWFDSVRCIDTSNATAYDGALSFTSTGFEINWSTISAAWSIGYIAFGGSDFSAKVLTHTKTGTGSASLTGAGFQPKAVFGITALSAADVDTSAGQARRSLAFADDDADEHSVGTQSADGATAADASRILGTSLFWAMRSASNATTVLAGSVTSLDADGLTVNYATLAVSPSYFAFLCFGGSGVNATDITSLQADTTTGAHTQTFGSLPFSPDCGLLFGMSHTATNTNQTQGIATLGFFDRALHQAALIHSARDAADPTNCMEGVSSSGALLAYDSASGTPYTAHGAVSAIGATSIDVTWGSGKNASGYFWSALLFDLALTQTVNPDGIASTAALGEPALTPGAVTVSPDGIASTVALGEPSVSTGQVISLDGIAATTALGEPALLPGAVTINPDGIASTTALGLHALTPGPVTISLDGIASTAALGLFSLAQVLSIVLSGIESTVRFGKLKIFREGLWDFNDTTDLPAGTPELDTIFPETAVQLIEADHTHVAWIGLGYDYGWRREQSGPGSGQVLVEFDDPLRSQLTFNRRLAFWLRGNHVHTALIEPREQRPVDQGEENDEDVRVGGRGNVAVLDRVIVHPIRTNLRPAQTARHFNAYDPLFNDEDWVNAIDVSAPTEPGVDGPNDPDKWVGPGVPIWGPSGTPTFAPGGRCYFRRTVTIAAQGAVQLHVVGDNKFLAYLDGAKLIERLDNDAQNYRRTHVINVGPLDAGTHTLGFRVFNEAGPEPDPEDPLNPGYLRYALFAQDTDGNPTDLIVSSGPETLCLEYPEVEPGWTDAQVIDRLLDEEENRGGYIIGRSYTGQTDSDGIDWPVHEEVVVNIGDSMLAWLQQRADAYIDFTMPAHEDTLFLFNKGERGSHTGIDLPAGYTHAATGCLENLRHQTLPPEANSLLLRWADGFVIRTLELDPETDVLIEKFVSLQQLASEEQAEVIGDALLDILSQEQTKASATIDPKTDQQRPWQGWHEADWVDLPNTDGDLEEMRVQAVWVAVDDDGGVIYNLEAGDKIIDTKERFEAYLERLNPGFSRHAQRLPMPRIDDSPPAGVPAAVYEKTFHRKATDLSVTSGPWTADRDSMLFEFAVTLAAARGASTTITLAKNGVTVATVVIAAGATYGTARNLDTALVRGADVLTTACAATGFEITADARMTY